MRTRWEVNIKNIWLVAVLIIFLLPITLCKNINDQDSEGDEDAERTLSITSVIDAVQPFTGIVFWNDSDDRDTDSIQLEYTYLLYSDVVKNKSNYDWSFVENILNDISARGHQAIIRFRYTYPGYKTGVPLYIKNSSGYSETIAESEGLRTYFPDWSFGELENFTLEFYTEFAKKYDDDKRLAFLQTGFGLWAEYHIYDGPMILGKTFPSKAFQERFFIHLDDVFKTLYWSVSIDSSDDEVTPLKSNSELLKLRFGLFDDSFLCEEHETVNRIAWEFFTIDRYKTVPFGGELSYYTDYDQEHALDTNGPHGISFESSAKTYHISYMIGNDQPQYQTMSRIKEAGMSLGYKFRIKSCVVTDTYTKIIVENYGIAPIYYDAYISVNGVRASESLKYLLPNEEKEYLINSGGDNSKISIVCDRLVNGQEIQFEADIK